MLSAHCNAPEKPVFSFAIVPGDAEIIDPSRPQRNDRVRVGILAIRWPEQFPQGQDSTA